MRLPPSGSAKKTSDYASSAGCAKRTSLGRLNSLRSFAATSVNSQQSSAGFTTGGTGYRPIRTVVFLSVFVCCTHTPCPTCPTCPTPPPVQQMKKSLLIRVHSTFFGSGGSVSLRSLAAGRGSIAEIVRIFVRKL